MADKNPDILKWKPAVCGTVAVLQKSAVMRPRSKEWMVSQTRSTLCN